MNKFMFVVLVAIAHLIFMIDILTSFRCLIKFLLYVALGVIYCDDGSTMDVMYFLLTNRC